MKPRDKSAVMDAFKAGDLQLLVATTVIEVGVDVPNASLMIIENPERLGLAQLHQLRGRVGRGAVASHCVLLYQAPLSALARQRLGILRDSTDGFLIDLSRDAGMLDQVKENADIMLRDYPAHVEPLIRRWLGERELYGNV
jgi:ATP-dependent DNA helicase RecG